MHCPYCGEQVSESARVCGYCGRQIRNPAPAPPSPAPPPQPTTVIVQASNSEGLFSSLTGLINFAMAILVISMIVFIVLVFMCVIQLPSSFPIINLPSQLDVLWSRAVALQAQTCGSAPSTAPRYQPSVDQPVPDQPQPAPPDPIPPEPPECNSGLGEAECVAAGGNSTMMCDMKEGCHTICFCNK